MNGNEDWLTATWYAKPNDLIGGWCVGTDELPPSKASVAPLVADFMNEAVARHVAALHNQLNAEAARFNEEEFLARVFAKLGLQDDQPHNPGQTDMITEEFAAALNVVKAALDAEPALTHPPHLVMQRLAHLILTLGGDQPVTAAEPAKFTVTLAYPGGQEATVEKLTDALPDGAVALINQNTGRTEITITVHAAGLTQALQQAIAATEPLTGILGNATPDTAGIQTAHPAKWSGPPWSGPPQ